MIRCHEHIHSMNEAVPLEKAPESYEKMKKNAARFRMVLKMD